MDSHSLPGILASKSKYTMLKELFEKNKNIIINTDIDGIMSGIILTKYLGCNVVGFTNSKDSVWLADGFDDLYKHVYVDMFVTNDKAICVDQHIVAVNASHQQQIIDSGTKYSPQIDGNRIFTDTGFKYKYPFGTVQYIIAQLISEGIEIQLPPLNNPIPNSKIKMGDLIHRADDAMKSTLFAYEENATKWWDWLLKRSGNSQTLTDMIEYLNNIRSQCKKDVDADGKEHRSAEYEGRLKDYVEVVKANTKAYFAENFSCRTSDGGFKNIVDVNGNVYPFFLKYVNAIASLFECDNFSIPQHYNVHLGKYLRTRWIDIFEKDFLKDYTICGHKVFSYAFIYGPGNDSTTNFSFTVDMQ